MHWRDVWIGATLTAALFAIGKYLIGLYLGHSAVASVSYTHLDVYKRQVPESAGPAESQLNAGADDQGH